VFGFGKKALDNRFTANILVEVGMFQSWTLDNKRKDLDIDELNAVIRGVINREKIRASDNQIQAIVSMCIMNTDLSKMEQFRRQTGFDQQVAGFCDSVGLPSSYWR